MKIRNMFLSTLLAIATAFGATGCSGSVQPGNIGDVAFVDGDKIAEITIEDYGTIRAKLFPDLAPNGVDNFIQLAEKGYYNGLKIHRVETDTVIQGGSLNGDGTGGAAIINAEGEFAIEPNDKARNFYGALGYANTNGMNTTQFYIVTAKSPIDITQYDVQKFKDKSAEYTAQKELLDENSPDLNMLSAMETHYANLAHMLETATDEVKNKYNTTGGVPFWDGGYTVFGQVYEGFDVLDKINGVEVTLDNNGNKTRPLKDIIISSVEIITYATPTTAESDESSKNNSKVKTPSQNSKEDSSDSSSDDTAKTEQAPDTATIESGEEKQSTSPAA